MFVKDAISQTVAFVARRKNGEYHIGGTAFFVTHRVEDSSYYAVYCVTARHVVEEACSLGDGTVYLRVSSGSKGTEWYPIEQSKWEHHEKDGVDVSIAEVEDGEQIIGEDRHLFISRDNFCTRDKIEHVAMRPGDGLFFPGLFVKVPGTTRNIPILRTGTIAAIPEDPVPITICNRNYTANAYLAEVRSIGGHSGSPVFLHVDVEKAWELKGRRTGIENPILIGLVHGHYGFRQDQFENSMSEASSETESTSVRGFRTEDFNSGIAVIVPVDEILHVLNQPRLRENRAKERDQLMQSGDDPNVV